MNSVDASIDPTLTYYTLPKKMWLVLKNTYSHDKNFGKILQVEEIYKIQQGDQELSQNFVVLAAAYECLKAIRPC